MTLFRQKPGTKSAFRHLEKPFPDVTVFDAVVRSLIHENLLGSTSYMTAKKLSPGRESSREVYRKIPYENVKGNQIGTGLDTCDSIEGISAVLPLLSLTWQTLRRNAERSVIFLILISSP